MEVALALPFPDANPEQWRQFVRVMVRQGPAAVENGRMGLFAMSMRRLESLGLMSNGGFIPPLTAERFFETPRIQYNAFKTSIAEYRDALVKSGLDRELGKLVGGESLTMSGLLGLASQAGIKGARSWLANPADRTRFPHTTKVFIETNGIF